MKVIKSNNTYCRMFYPKCLTYSLHNLLHFLYQRCHSNNSTPSIWTWIASNLLMYVKVLPQSLIYASKNVLCVTIRVNLIFEISLSVSGIQIFLSQYQLCVLMHIRSSLTWYVTNYVCDRYAHCLNDVLHWWISITVLYDCQVLIPEVSSLQNS